MKTPTGTPRDVRSHHHCHVVVLDGTIDSQHRDREEDIDGSTAAPIADNVVFGSCHHFLEYRIPSLECQFFQRKHEKKCDSQITMEITFVLCTMKTVLRLNKLDYGCFHCMPSTFCNRVP